MLYRPSQSELSSVIQSFREKFPILASRIDKAVDIVTDLELQAAGESWIVPSQSSLDASYVVNTQSGSCTCPDFQRHYNCKHLIAADTYEKTLEANMKERIIGNNAAAIQQAKMEPWRWLIRVANTPSVTNVGSEAIRFKTGWNSRHRSVGFASADDAEIFSHWLAKAKNIEWSDGNRKHRDQLQIARFPVDVEVLELFAF